MLNAAELNLENSRLAMELSDIRKFMVLEATFLDRVIDQLPAEPVLIVP